MDRNFKKYEFEVIDKKFFYDENLLSEQTAIVKFFKNEQDFEEIEFGYINAKDFNKILHSGQNIKISHCLIENASQIFGKFTNFTLRNCLIVSDKQLVFDLYISEKTDFSESIFIATDITFEKSQFSGAVNFANTFFLCENFNFNQTTFQKGLSFKNAKFGEGTKLFENIIVETGEVNFNNVDFGQGNISFQDAKLGSDRKTFVLARFGEGFVDFTRTNFGGNYVIFERVNFGDGNLTFRSADFGNGTVDFRRAEFGNGEKSFIHTNFGDGNIKFVNSIFKSGKVNFRLADFGRGDVDFHFTHFDKTDLVFDRTKFHNGTLNFRGVDIAYGRIIFNHIEFGNGDFIFESFEQKNGTFTVKNSVFGKGFINFENAVCQTITMNVENVDFGYGTVSFSNAVFEQIRLKNTQLNSYFDMRVKKVQLIDFSNAVIKDVLDLNPSGNTLNVNQIYLQGVRLLGRIYIDWHLSEIKQKIMSQDVTYKEKSEQFRILKENYRNMGLYDYEDKAYVEFKRMEALAKLENIKHLKFFARFSKRLSHSIEVMIFDKMGQYATNPLRVLLSMGILFLFFSFLFLILEYLFPGNAQIVSSLFDSGNPQVMGKVAKAFYHSAITFLTIGYGDYYPVGIIRILSGVEGFIGLFMMSYFTVAFVRKILR